MNAVQSYNPIACMATSVGAQATEGVFGDALSVALMGSGALTIFKHFRANTHPYSKMLAQLVNSFLIQPLAVKGLHSYLTEKKEEFCSQQSFSNIRR